MKILKNILLLFVICGVFFFSCKKDKPVPQPLNTDYNYYPDDVGRYAIYQIDSIAYDDVIHPPDTTSYQLKEVIASIFIDNSGRPTLRLERFLKLKKDTGFPAVPNKVWYANRTSTTAERVEENIRYIRLVFPSAKNKTWDGNAYNILGQKQYEIISTDQAETVNTLFFDSVVTVKQFEQIDFIEKIYEAEKFAKNVGLIYKQQDSIYTGGNPNKRIGYSFTQKIITYGK